MIGNITICEYRKYNYGNIFQNYAINHFFRKKKIEFKSIHCIASYLPGYLRILFYQNFHIYVSNQLKVEKSDNLDLQRDRNFEKFIAENIKPKRYGWYSERTYRDINKRFGKVIVGSDQVWNPYFSSNKGKRTLLLGFLPPEKRISYAASFGISELPEQWKDLYRDALKDYRAISVREKEGAQIVKELTGRDVPVLIDPTMLLTVEDWRKVEKPSPARKGKNYILTYFLGEQSPECRKRIRKISQQHNLDVLELCDRSQPEEYVSGPSEFLDLFDHASLVFTDSFHATVFSILFGKPFVVHNRIQEGMENMGSRITTLLKKLDLECRLPGRVSDDDLFWCDYQRAYELLEVERQKAKDYLLRACTDET